MCHLHHTLYTCVRFKYSQNKRTSNIMKIFIEFNDIGCTMSPL